MFQTFIGIVALSALLGLINKKLLKLPETIGVMILAILTSALLGLYSLFDAESIVNLCTVIHDLDFRTILFEFLLGFLLFAGAMHVNFQDLAKEWRPVLLYATLGVLISTFIVGTLVYYIAPLVGINIPYIYALVFGSLISPTDPIAVLALLTKAGTSKDIEIKIVGESLFNDGVGIVVFLTILSLATSMDAELSFSHITQEFLKEVVGGVVMGIALGFLGSFIIKRLEADSVLAIHVTLAIVMGGYSMSAALHISGAIAMVVAGLVMGHTIHDAAFDKHQRKDVYLFWKVIDEILNSILFVLIGLEIIALDFNVNYFVLGLISIVIVLFARYISLTAANIFIKSKDRSSFKTLGILTWAGLRGGISIALVFSLPEGEIRTTLLMVTYVIVVFSIVVQGLSIERVVKYLKA